MSGNRGNNNEKPSTSATVVTAVAGVAAAYGAFKLFGSLFGSTEPHESFRQESDIEDEDNIYLIETVEELQEPLRKLRS